MRNCKLVLHIIIIIGKCFSSGEGIMFIFIYSSKKKCFIQSDHFFRSKPSIAFEEFESIVKKDIKEL